MGWNFSSVYGGADTLTHWYADALVALVVPPEEHRPRPTPFVSCTPKPCSLTVVCVALEPKMKLNGIEHAVVDQQVQISDEVPVLVFPGKQVNKRVAWVVETPVV